jgi:hypothetical protein
VIYGISAAYDGMRFLFNRKKRGGRRFGAPCFFGIFTAGIARIADSGLKTPDPGRSPVVKARRLKNASAFS